MSVGALVMCAFMVDSNPFQDRRVESWRFSLHIEPAVSALMRVLQPIAVLDLVLDKLGVVPLRKSWRVRLHLSGCDANAAGLLARRLEQYPCVVSVALSAAPGADTLDEPMSGQMLGEDKHQQG